MTVNHRPTYSQAEQVSDAVVHVTGLVAVVAAVPVMIVLAAILRGDTPAVLGAAIYGVTLVLMILCSALFNMNQRPARAWVLQRMDHSAIYLKIAGTYTPFVLITGQGGVLAAVVWLAAAVGVVLKMVSPVRFRLLALGLYLAMGWAGLIAGGDLMVALPSSVVTLMGLGGLLYSVGVVFYLWDRLAFHYTIWHIFVLTATMLIYAAVVTLLVIGPATPIPAG